MWKLNANEIRNQRRRFYAVILIEGEA